MAQSPNRVDCSTLFTVGRDCVGPTAVVLHEFKSGIEMLDAEMCRCIRPRPLTSPGCHTSFHYGVGGNCNFRQYVDDADTAWGFYYIPTPACPTPPCPIVQTCDGIGADQYNPELDGTLPTPVVAAGADLTANCSVIHVAVITGAAHTGSGIYCIGSQNFSERAYNCLVQSLCYIFDVNGLTPVGYSTLLTHIGELMDLDLTQLAIDIQACLDAVPPPLPACDCAQTPLSAVDSSTLDFTVSGTDNHTLTGAVKISSTAANSITSNATGIYSPEITGTNTPSVTLTISGTDNHNVQADVNISADIGNTIISNPDGLFSSGGLPTPYEDCTSAAPLNLNGMQYLAANGDGTGLDWYRVSDPVNYQLATTIDVIYNFSIGKTMHLINSLDDTLLLTNPPDATCSQRDLWIKNISQSDLVISSSVGGIDGNSTLTLAGSIPLTASGDSVHLVWSSQLDGWYILAIYRNA